MITTTVPEHLDTLCADVRRFLDTHVRPVEHQLESGGRDERCKISAEIRDRAKACGLWGLSRPADLGGRGLPLAEYASIAEIEGRYVEGPTALGSNSLLDITMLHKHAGPAVRDRYLTPMMDGTMTPCYGMTEPGRSGSDLLQLRTHARRDGDSWVIDGQKWFSKVRRSDFMTVFCRTAGLGASSRSAFSMIVVPTDAAGFTVVRDLPVLGADGGHAEVSLRGVRVPLDHLVGPEGGGLSIALERLSLGRLLRAFTWIGQAQRAYELMLDRLQNRRVATGVLAEKQLLQAHVFDSYTELTSARLLLRQAASLLDAGHPSVAEEVSAAKVVTSRMFQRVTDRAIQVYGAEGLTDDTPLSALFREARSTRIYDGPDELHIQAVAQRLLARHQQGAPTRPGRTDG